MFSRMSSLLMICKAKGILSAYHEVKGNWLYDILNLTDTAIWLPTDAYASKYDTTDVVRYQATHTDTIDLAIEQASKIVGKKVHSMSLLDLGSGKGKVVARSVQLGLGEATGVELNKELHTIAMNNIAAVSNYKITGGHSVNENCISYLREHDLRNVDIVFMYNPFTGSVMEDVLRALRYKKEAGADFVIAYVNPEQDQTVQNHFCKVDKRVSSGGQQINFYL